MYLLLALYSRQYVYCNHLFCLFVYSRQESEKALALQSHLDQESSKKNSILSELSLQSSEIAHLKAKEVQLIKEVHQLRDMKRKFEEDVFKIKLETEQYFSQLYKTQSAELHEEMEEKLRMVRELEEERTSLFHQLQIALARADSEALARSIAEETVADLEKEKTIKELELKDLATKHRNELSHKESTIMVMKDVEYDVNMKLSKRAAEIEDLLAQNKKLQEEVAQQTMDRAEIERLQQKLKNETLLKQTAVNKLTEVMSRKDQMAPGKNNKAKAGSAGDLKKKEKEARRLQQELTQEREKYNQLLVRFSENQTALAEEVNQRTKLQMEIDSKDTQIEMMQNKLVETKSLSSAENDAAEDGSQDSIIEGWLSVPNKQNIRRHGWKRQYVVVSSRKIIFYNSELEKLNSDPVLILDLSKVFHVRSVTQGDVIRADARDISRIFQLLYAMEGEARRPDDQQQDGQALTDGSERSGVGNAAVVAYKGHAFVAISYHMPTNCEVCPKQMWQMFRPPPAYECKRCHIKMHKEHVDYNDPLVPCKLHHDPQYAREMLLLASTDEDQAKWVSRLSKRIQKCGFKANSSANNSNNNSNNSTNFNNSDGGSKISPR